ncbi:tyrosine recombinase XerC [Streptomyces sp. NPDC060286]|uniref:site-specific integrase n=1 Tax=unclassified Streptomyces TaxID=2593676 RepID=UPI0035D8D072
MVYRKDHAVAPELTVWRDIWISKTGKAGSAEKATRTVSAVAHGLGVAPGDLPENALELYVKVQPLAPSTLAGYRWALKQWQRYLTHGFQNLERSPMTSKDLSASDEKLTDPHLEKWRRHLRARNRAATTITGYLRIMQGVAEIAECDPIDIEEEDVLAFIIHRREQMEAKGKDLSASRHNVYLAAVRSFCRVNRRPDATEFIERIPRDSVSTPGASREDVRGLLDAAVSDMASSDAMVADTGRRMWMLTRLMSGVGYRISTACHLFSTDLKLNDDGWRLHPQFVKARRGQPKPSHPAPEDIAQELLTNWQHGESVMSIDLSAKQAAQQWRGWAESHGYGHVRPHMLRAYFIKSMYIKTGDVYGVSRAADHRQVETTEGYIGNAQRPEVENARRMFDVGMPVRIPGQRTDSNVLLLRPRAESGSIA